MATRHNLIGGYCRRPLYGDVSYWGSGWRVGRKYIRGTQGLLNYTHTHTHTHTQTHTHKHIQTHTHLVKSSLTYNIEI